MGRDGGRRAHRVSPWAAFDRASWRALAAGAELPLDEAGLDALASLGDRIDLDEVATVYLPLAELLGLHVAAGRRLWAAQSAFLGDTTAKVPFVIAVAGSVAVGKSTTARLLQSLLAAGPGSPGCRLVTTDGFLLPNAVLEERGLLGRKGFPESYDRRALLRFLAAVKSGARRGRRAGVRPPGLRHRAGRPPGGGPARHPRPGGPNVLQAGGRPDGTAPEVFLSDFFDFSVYVDAAEADIQRWYVDRFLALRRTAFADAIGVLPPVRRPHRRAGRDDGAGHLDGGQRPEPAEQHRAHPVAARLVLQKSADHSVRRVLLRKL